MNKVNIANIFAKNQHVQLKDRNGNPTYLKLLIKHLSTNKENSPSSEDDYDIADFDDSIKT
jgi:hypothetical protein